MAGSNITIDDSEVIAALNQLLNTGSDLTPFFGDVGESLLISHEQRWSEERGADGTPWEPLKPETLARKQKKGKDNGILTQGGYLRALHYSISNNELMLGTSRKYGATHQFGDDSRNIPARPFLGFSDSDHDEILEILSEHLKRELK